MQRFLIALCHPRKIGLYFKDKMGIVIGCLLVMIAFFVGSTAINSYAYPQFNYDTATSIANLITGTDSKTKYDSTTGKLTGEAKNKEVYQGSNFNLAFYTTDTAQTPNAFAIIFAEEHVYFKYGSIVISKLKYTDLKIDSFSVSEIQSNVVKRDDFAGVIFLVLNQSKTNFATFNFIINVLSTLMYAVFILFISNLFSYFRNPTISFNVRIKLNIYCLFIFFLFVGLAYMANAAWLQYVGILLSVVYSGICFSHIIRIS